MKFRKVVFTHPISVPFMDLTQNPPRPAPSFAHSIGSLQTFEAPGAPTAFIDSIEPVGAWIIATYLGQRIAIPVAMIDAAELEADEIKPSKGKAA